MIRDKQILLVYPSMGMSGALVRHIPLSLVYAAADSIKVGFAVDIVDIRLSPATWQPDIAAAITADTVLVGISVMTGMPIGNALEISRWLKANYPAIACVWGGPHATFSASEILDESSVDYVVCGYGSMALARLARHLCGDAGAPQLNAIPGLVYRDISARTVVQVPPASDHEILDYRDIPYHLIEKNLNLYGQLDSTERIFPMYSTMGCPYGCTFCSSPAQYGNMERTYTFLTPRDVVEHIELVVTKYKATYIYFIDDDSFINPAHVEAIIDEINRRDIRVRLGFRGAHINDVKRMNGAYLAKLAAAGTNILHIGAESGSQRMLDLMKKNCTVDDILEVNRKLALYPQITAAYNWLIGLPGETLDDLLETRELIIRMLKENPSAIIFAPNKYRPLPGTELYEIALANGYQKPTRQEEWIHVEVEGRFQPAWYGREFARMVNMMIVTSYFIDDKLFKVTLGNTFAYRCLKVMGKLYAPMAKFRFRHGISFFLFEYLIFNFIARRIKS